MAKRWFEWHKIAEVKGYISEKEMFQELSKKYCSAYAMSKYEFPGIHCDTVRARARRYGIFTRTFNRFRLKDLAVKKGYRSIKKMFAAMIEKHGRDEQEIADDLGIIVEIVRSGLVNNGNPYVVLSPLKQTKTRGNSIYYDQADRNRRPPQPQEQPEYTFDNDEDFGFMAETNKNFDEDIVWGKIFETHLSGWELRE